LNPHKHGFRTPLLIYSFAFTASFYSAIIYIGFIEDVVLKTKLLEITNATFALIEFSFFGFYFHKILKIKFISFINASYGVMLLILLVNFLAHTRKGKVEIITLISGTDRIVSLELIMLIVLSLIYYYKILKDGINKKLTTEPSFWIITGLFFYSIVSTPFFIIGLEILLTDLRLYYFLFALHYLFSAILFITISKAFLCNRNPAT
jgi:hypothetical protein